MSTEFVPHEGMIRAADVTSGAPLKQSEISRFIRTIDAEAFQKDETTPRKSNAPFKPKSLMDLAREGAERAVQQEREEAEKAALAQAAELAEIAPLAADDVTAEDEAAPSDADTNAVLADVSVETEGPAPEAEVEVAASVEEPAVEQSIEPEPVASRPAENPDSDVLEAAKVEAFEAGRAEGHAQARAEVDDMMSHALGLLETAVAAFTEQGEKASETLAETLQASVVSLASSRAGSQIDSLPKAFLHRIQAIAERVQSSVSAPIVRVHPRDLIVLQPLLEQSSKLLALRLVEDEELSRGDMDLALEGIRLTDVLPRIDQVPQVINYVPLTLAEDALHGDEGVQSADPETGEVSAEGELDDANDAPEKTLSVDLSSPADPDAPEVTSE